MHIYIPTFACGVICGVVGIIALEIAAVIISDKKSKKKKGKNQ